ncbi:MAG: C_GCAxxG_C_C family protein, partial [Clostridia bacterium]|nr:C_GCAxxG_C_C family protein [Clostridia bacterium]
MNAEERSKKAVALFTEGYNCSQAVALAFDDLLPIDRDVLARIARSFGGGIGRLREVCGCVSGMAAVVGALYGFSGAETGGAKAE